MAISNIGAGTNQGLWQEKSPAAGTTLYRISAHKNIVLFLFTADRSGIGVFLSGEIRMNGVCTVPMQKGLCSSLLGVWGSSPITYLKNVFFIGYYTVNG
jgi:hypothetical protein